MKIAIKMKETLTRTVILEADDYTEGEDIVADAHSKGRLYLDADNASVELSLEDDTKEYIEIFGEEEFRKLENTII